VKFTEAVKAIAQGKKARRRGWAPNAAIRYEPRSYTIVIEFEGPEGIDERLGRAPWHPNPGDESAEDWEIRE
jgi:hypothetical protein